MVTLNRGDSSGFGFSLLGTAGLPHVIYDIIENSPAAKSGKVSTTYTGFDRIFIRVYILVPVALPVLAWYHFRVERGREREREREKFEDGQRWSYGKEQPQFLHVYTHLTLCIRYAFVRRESCEREQPQNNARCISTRVIIASTLCRPVCFLTSDHFLLSRFRESCFLVLLQLLRIYSSASLTSRESGVYSDSYQGRYNLYNSENFEYLYVCIYIYSNQVSIPETFVYFMHVIFVLIDIHSYSLNFWSSHSLSNISNTMRSVCRKINECVKYPYLERTQRRRKCLE